MPAKTPDLAWIPRFGYASRLCFCATCTPASRLTRADARFRIRGRPIVTTKSALVIAALVTALAPVPSLYAATQGNTLADYAVTTWTEKEGLPAGRIRAIAQGFEGYLWLGLETGLVRFDGVRFVPWAGAPLPPGHGVVDADGARSQPLPRPDRRHAGRPHP